MKPLLATILLLTAVASAETVAITNARIISVTSPPIERGTLIIRDGVIAAVGAKVPVPAGARRIDAAGLGVYPGWIDAWTRIGLVEVPSIAGSVDVAEIGDFNPAAQAWIAVNPHSETIRTARVNGVTTALAAPGGGLISGTASAVDLLGNYPNEMRVLGDAAVVINVPSLYRTGTRGPANESPQDKRRRIEAQVERLKQYLREAKRYADMRGRTGDTPGVVDTSLEALIPLMRGQRPAIFTADHFRDIRTAVEFGDEFGLKVLIAGGLDAWKVADLLARKKVGVLYAGVHELPRTNEDPYDAPFATPEVLRRAGVPFAIVSASSGDSRNLPYRAALAAAYGLEREDALKSITIWPATLLGVADKVGSIEAGKLANVIVAKGDPLDIRSEIRHVFIRGREVPPETRNLQLFEEFRPAATSNGAK